MSDEGRSGAADEGGPPSDARESGRPPTGFPLPPDAPRSPLPPPVFPSGSGRQRPPRRPRREDVPPEEGETEDGDRIPDEAFLDPYEPIVRTRPPTTPGDYEAVLKSDEEPAEDEGVATGIGDARHADDPPARERFGDIDLDRLVRSVGRLADALRLEGHDALRTRPDMSRLEVDLRAYCAGYLAGRRERREG